jgi:hypothetical protein
LVFERPGDYELKVAVRLDHSAINTRGWRETEILPIRVAPRRDRSGSDLTPPSPEVQRILEKGIKAASWRDDLAALERIDGELGDYAQFRIGEFFYFTATGWSNFESRWHTEFGSAESAASRSISAFARLSDRCSGLRRRGAFRTISLLVAHPQARETVDYDRLTQAFHLKTPVPFQPLDPFHEDRTSAQLRQLAILFAPHARLDAQVKGTFVKGVACRDFYGRLSRECGIPIVLPDDILDRPVRGGDIDMPLRELLFRHSTQESWWELEKGTVTLHRARAKPN